MFVKALSMTFVLLKQARTIILIGFLSLSHFRKVNHFQQRNYLDFAVNVYKILLHDEIPLFFFLLSLLITEIFFYYIFSVYTAQSNEVT